MLDVFRGVDGGEPLGIIDGAVAAGDERDGIKRPLSLRHVRDGKRSAHGLRALRRQRRGHEVVVPWVAAERAMGAAGDRIARRRGVSSGPIEQDSIERSSTLQLPHHQRAQMAVVQRRRVGWPHGQAEGRHQLLAARANRVISVTTICSNA